MVGFFMRRLLQSLATLSCTNTNRPLTTMTQEKPRRRWYQFSHRALLVAVATGVGVGYATWHVGSGWAKVMQPGEAGIAVYFFAALVGIVASIIAAFMAERAQRF